MLPVIAKIQQSSAQIHVSGKRLDEYTKEIGNHFNFRQNIQGVICELISTYPVNQM